MGVGFKKQPEGSQEQALRGAEETEIADLDEAPGEDVLEEAVDELFGGKSAEGDLAGSGRAVAKGDLVVFEFYQAAVADGDPEDVRGEILEGRAAITDRFAVNNPVLLRDGGGDSVDEAGFLQGVQEFGLEDSGESFEWEQEVVAGRQPGAMIG